MEVHPNVDLALRFAGPAFFMGIQAASIKSASGIWSMKNTRGLPMLPYISLLVNCIIWTMYGFLKEDLSLIVPSGCGILTGIYCTGIYMSCSEVSRSNNTLCLGALVCACIAGGLFVFDEDYYLGLLGVVISCILLGSPLATLGTVIREKSTASLPFTTTLFMTLNALSWMSYGLLITHDFMVSVMVSSSNSFHTLAPALFHLFIFVFVLLNI